MTVFMEQYSKLFLFSTLCVVFMNAAIPIAAVLVVSLPFISTKTVHFFVSVLDISVVYLKNKCLFYFIDLQVIAFSSYFHLTKHPNIFKN